MSNEKLIELLMGAGSAHHTYEQTELKGVYDQNWANWYAGHLVNNDINSYLNQPITVDQLGKLLADISARHQESDQSQSWAEFTAEKLLA